MMSDANTPIDYIEFTSPELEKTQAFFTEAFGWSYVDYGPDYKDIQGAGLGGGVERGPLRAPLPVLKADDLEAMLARVKAAGAEITQEIFEFPGGRRFQFREPGGTEMAVWTTVDDNG
ncbi:VOC family protein [Rhodobacteraceae bacterium N5(2021)]|uniref:VOC family protein n=1 Tax=Gymnodinialimonas phycosphaerae TaxID=2841589 RepID=A0A975YFE0_9RHOB|nr:VOC family protein [Gymnodinialimonas phycosphaerae]MBY4894653.1 VOC family protein [Gymnodinialimonas phycosphaerae]